MSSTLYWKPVVPNEGESLSFELKKTLSRHLWDTDGSFGGEPAEMTAKDIPILKGMTLVGSEVIRKDCETLIAAIEQHGAVVLWHQY